jgi:CHRD domain
MENRKLLALTAVGLAAAIAVPTIAFGNARNTGTGTLAGLHESQTPIVALMSGAQETPAAGDADGTGAASFTIDVINAGGPLIGDAQICWDISYAGLTGVPTAAHIHRGAAGVAGPIVVLPANTSFTNLTATGTTGCGDIEGTLGEEILANPAGFYVNVHTTDFTGGAIRGQLALGPEAAGEAHLLPTPLRAYDSRLNAGPKIAPGETRTISLTTGFTLAAPTVPVLAVPPGATAAIITLTIAETNAPGGFLTIYSAASAQPATSSINWKAADQDVAVGTQVAVDASGNIKVTDGVGTAPTHFIIDVVGYMY